ncbi:MAG TPA: lysylphosphatidylglycerol synthase domain-containing protein [Holophagaceae bacterium]|jgi:uncharacterized membrane protein YbhN (UPF0104 family)|nr:lysylphosphatidylglycerol synthase domain-containing protein [Holophagaceae bacterium]
MSEEFQPGTSGQAWKRRALWLLKLGFTILLLALAFQHVPLRALGDAWSRIRMGWAIGAVIIYVPLCVLAESARLWAAGRRVAAPPLTIREWASAFLASRPWFYLLPASAGADGMVWYHLRRKGWSHGGCGYTLLSVRFWGLALWALIAGMSLIMAPETGGILSGIPPWLMSPRLWLAGGCITLLGCALAPHWLARKEHVDLKSAGPADPFLHLSLTVFSALIAAASVWMAARATALPFGLLTCLGLLAWLTFAMALPISLGGLGLQEALVLRLGLPLGLPAATLLAFSGIVHLMRAILALTGGLAAIKGDPIPPGTQAASKKPVEQPPQRGVHPDSRA